MDAIDKIDTIPMGAIECDHIHIDDMNGQIVCRGVTASSLGRWMEHDEPTHWRIETERNGTIIAAGTIQRAYDDYIRITGAVL